jgi:hypothetical protein
MSSDVAATKLVWLKYRPSPELETVINVTMEMMMKHTLAFIDTAETYLRIAATEPANVV